MTARHKPWTAEDDKTMRDNAGKMSDGEIGTLTGHTRETVCRYRNAAGLPAYHADRRNWTRRQRLLQDAAGVEEDGDDA